MRRLVALAGVVAAGVAAGSAAALETKEVPAEWDVAGVAANGRAIDLFFNAGGCIGSGRATAVETPSTVTLTVVTTVPSASGIPCTAIYMRKSVRVALAAPLAGRAIRGRPVPARPVPLETAVPGLIGDRVAIRAPSLVGFSPWEARRALRRRDLKMRVRTTRDTGERAQVLGQAPPAGSAILRGRTVRVRIGVP